MEECAIDQLETIHRATRDVRLFYGREFRSKLVISHRVFFTIDEDAQVVYAIDMVHTARPNKLDEYTPRRSRGSAPPVTLKPPPRPAPS